MKKLLTAVVMGMFATFLVVANAQAVPITTGGLTFTELTADLELTGGSGTGTELDPILLYEDVFGLDVTMSIEGLSSIGDPSGSPFAAGFYITKVVTNKTGEDWDFYDHELQETLGIPSTDGDGLSFAQGWATPRPWTSDVFTDVDEIVDVRDYINFSNGVVLNGETVVFSYLITDNSPEDIFYLRQRPNYQPGQSIPDASTLFLLGSACLMGFAGARRRFIK